MPIFDHCPERDCDPCDPDYLRYRGDVIVGLQRTATGWQVDKVNLATGVGTTSFIDDECPTVNASDIVGLCDAVLQCLPDTDCEPPSQTVSLAPECTPPAQTVTLLPLPDPDPECVPPTQLILLA